MKKERRPPKTWRRNMLAGAGLLALLDGTILSVSIDAVRVALALVLTLFVGGFIVAVWRSNTKLEKSGALAKA
jgi:hypothetical protein